MKSCQKCGSSEDLTSFEVLFLSELETERETIFLCSECREDGEVWCATHNSQKTLLFQVQERGLRQYSVEFLKACPQCMLEKMRDLPAEIRETLTDLLDQKGAEIFQSGLVVLCDQFANTTLDDREKRFFVLLMFCEFHEFDIEEDLPSVILSLTETSLQ